MLLVTGITGLTGRFLFREFQQNHQVEKLRCLIRKTSDVSWMSGSKPELIYGDVNEVNDLVKGMNNISGVIHLYNIRHVPQVIEACIKTGVKRVVFVTTTGIYSKYQEYSALYRELEEKIIDSRLDYTIIRPTMIYGNGQDKNIHKLIKLIKDFPIFPVVGEGNSLMQPIYAGDLARVIYKAYQCESSIYQAYNVAGKEPIRYLSMLKEITNALGKKPNFIHIPYSLALFVARLGNLIPNGLIGVEKIQRLSEDKVFDYSKAYNELGFSPLSFREGVRLEVDSLMDGNFRI